jgi:hypothetical protein
VDNDYTIRLEGKLYRIVSEAMPQAYAARPEAQ